MAIIPAIKKRFHIEQIIGRTVNGISVQLYFCKTDKFSFRECVFVRFTTALRFLGINDTMLHAPVVVLPELG